MDLTAKEGNRGVAAFWPETGKKSAKPEKGGRRVWSRIE
jgi:hypothetical protein